MAVMQLGPSAPRLGRDVFVAATAAVIGRVTLHDAVSIWYGTVVRGDVGSIEIGSRTNIQDSCVVHVTSGKFDTAIAHDVSVGHRVVLHGCNIADHVLVGMGCIIMDGCEVGRYSLIGAGSLLTPGTRIPERSLVVGSPARVVRPLRPDEIALIDHTAALYVQLGRQHAETARPVS